MSPDSGAQRPAAQLDVAISSLIPTVAKAHRKLAGSLLQQLGLAAGQEFVLMQLWEQSPQSQAELTRRLLVEPPTMAKSLARLESLGLVTRERSTTDRRVMLVSLTERGEALQDPVRGVWLRLESLTTAGLTGAEQRTLKELLTRLTVNIAEASREPDERSAGVGGD